MDTTCRQNSHSFLMIFLGVLSAFGPFIMDMYLPTLPGMAEYFHTSSSMVQLGLTTGMIGLAIGQLVFGPISDKYGRRPLLLASLSLFLVATLCCIFSPDVSRFVFFRLLQGVAGSGCVVLSRSVAADAYTGRRLAGTLAVIGSINGVATVAAPIGGGLLAEWAGWHGIFWFLLVLGVLLLLGSIRFRESLPAGRRQACGWRSVCRNFGEVLRNRHYLCYIMQYGFTMGVLFVNIASAPFIMQQYYGLSPLSFSLCFGVNAVAMIIASAVAVKMSDIGRALYQGSRGMVLVSILLMAGLTGGCSFWVYESLIFILLVMLGMAYTASNALAMDCERRHAGIASALLGAMGFAVGGIVSPLVGLVNIRLSAGVLFVVASLCAYVCARYALTHLRMQKETVPVS